MSEELGNPLLALSTFFIWLSTYLGNHIVGILTVVILFITLINQLLIFEKNRFDLKKSKEEIKIPIKTPIKNKGKK